jgi:hypothetical protein
MMKRIQKRLFSTHVQGNTISCLHVHHKHVDPFSFPSFNKKRNRSISGNAVIFENPPPGKEKRTQDVSSLFNFFSMLLFLFYICFLCKLRTPLCYPHSCMMNKEL